MSYILSCGIACHIACLQGASGKSRGNGITQIYAAIIREESESDIQRGVLGLYACTGSGIGYTGSCLFPDGGSG